MEILDENGKTISKSNEESKRILAGVLAILLGGLAIHKFILGYTKTGIIQLVLTFATCGAVGLISLIEGIIYLTKTDEEFINTYQINKKEWF
ncbi:MAG: TM2 domain-containing protein [Lutibacter sp.]|uniref:TM2 domain-containing protein n=1 Tax=Lutibacter sp. TaxID=1925666 RepID=UPI0018227036|nr:TM2 domain-containing protein [Lutibacter sp.]MBT8318216.1 TM2 domain-containing protein [Lutibacter sp.]NNJ59076.1 TM2 domain-containing protein [Lutibacter sp.]